MRSINFIEKGHSIQITRRKLLGQERYKEKMKLEVQLEMSMRNFINKLALS